MAKWGHGDPRWIVEDRPDATNVNNWHWTEKNASQWSKDKLNELLTNFEVDEPGVGLCHITSVDSIDGEAVANNRKGKLIFFYEWVIKCQWKGRINGSDDEVKGSIEIPNLSEENSADEIDVNISVETQETGSDILKEVMRKKGTELIRKQLQTYILQLRDDFAKDMIKPSKLMSGGNINAFKTESQSKIDAEKKSEETKTKMSSFNGITKKPEDEKFETTSLKFTEELKCMAEDFYRSFTEVELIQAFTRGPAVVNASVGGAFELFGGNVVGTFTELVPNKLIKQNWRFKSWPSEHYSQVTITLDQKSDCTDVTVEQLNIPKHDFERTENGWKYHYFESLKRTFGFGASLN
ncbi:activator of 90 kDa heat shock protein ATPase homolog 1-like [Oppia nitens]|uniref:activator of 90 kDa heat shock protein ATPase homolog 1-like n=1 Tax=Oppia nitens TaxID=1686743 RepID=UPI0023DBDCD4|nr:activator of 90 kDa heat shock protein ATPase homolog 1-like [Oppia nitens]